MEDEMIYDLYFARDEEAIRQTEKKYGRYCFKIAYDILYNREDAGECVNDTWIRTWNAIPPKRPAIFSSFLAAITRNLSLNRYEERHAEKRGNGEIPLCLDELSEVIGKKSDVEENMDLIYLKDSLNRFLRDLPKKERILFVQRYFYVLSIDEIARKNLLSPSNVKMTLLRTREKLREELRKEGYAV